MRRLLALILLLTFSGCVPWYGRPVLPVAHSLTRDQLVLYSDFNLPQRHRLIDDVVALRDDVAYKLKLPKSDEPINVYLFDNQRRYRRFMKKHYPEFSERRAFFVKSDTALTVYAFWGDHIAEDLRHEVTHGYLHSAVPNLPLWLDEGLAEYFEVPRGRHGVNEPHVQLLWQQYEKDQWTPDLQRLEQLDDAAGMSQPDYAEAWLWVHLLLESTPERLELLQQTLDRLRGTGNAPPLSALMEQAELSPERQLVRHLKKLAGR